MMYTIGIDFTYIWKIYIDLIHSIYKLFDFFSISQEIVEIEEKEFADKARQLNIHSLTNFYSSDIFKAHKFVHDPKRKTITQAF